MRGTQCVLTLAALCVGLVHSWDIAVSFGEKLVLYTNGTKTNTVIFTSQNLTALVYDEVHNMMLYVDKQTDNDAICGYNLSSKEKRCFIERNGRNIQSLAFDPVTETLFFTDTKDKSINWISLKSEYNNNRYGNLLITMDDQTPTEVAVDSCRGYIYWASTNTDKFAIIERARFDGSERERTYKQYLDIYSLAIDPATQKMYYFDGAMLGSYKLFLNSAELSSPKVETIINDYDHLSISKVLTVSKDYIYWMNGSETEKTIWKLPKNAQDTEATQEEIHDFSDEIPLSIATNYKIADQTQGLENCEILTRVISTITEARDFIVEGCDVSVCENYCLQGNCSVNDERLPLCSCNAGYLGDRCEINVCYGYCLNNGDCSLNEEEKPVCHCDDDHEGSRCEAVKSDTFPTTPTYDMKRNLTLVDLLSRWRKPGSNMFVVIEV